MLDKTSETHLHHLWSEETLLSWILTETADENFSHNEVAIPWVEKRNVLHAVVSRSQGTDHAVTQKLFSTLRLVTQVWFWISIKSKILIFQGRETACIELGKNEALIEGVVKIEKYSLMPGLGIEAARLLSSIVRYSKNVNIASFTVRSRGTKILIKRN